MILSIFRNKAFLLGLILFIGLIVRIYKIDSPIADWHSWRQADTSAVTRNFLKEGFNPFYPRGDDMSGIAEKPIPNFNRYRFVEFPIYNTVVYPFYSLFGMEVKYDRLVSVLFSLGSTIFVYLIARRYRDTFTALVAALIFTILPFNVFFSRTTLPEPTFIFFALGMIYFVDRWIYEQKYRFLVIGLLFSITTFAIKPWGIFFALPLIYSIWKKEQQLSSKLVKYIGFALLALLPFLLWRFWILQNPEGIPASNWLMNGDGIRFRPAFWWWIFSERLGREILTVAGATLFALGVLVKPGQIPKHLSSSGYFLHFWLLSIFLYFAIFATGNVRHDYYQVLSVPVLAIFTAIGFTTLIRGPQSFIPRIWTIPLAIFLFALMLYFGWKNIKDFYNINNYPIVEAGIKADQILPENARVLAPYNGDTAFLYQINRPGLPIAILPIKELVSVYGITHYVSTAKDDKTNWVMRHFEVLEDHPNYVIADLTKLKKPFDTDDPEP